MSERIEINTAEWSNFQAKTDVFEVTRRGRTFDIKCLDGGKLKEHDKGLGLDDLAELYALVGVVLTQATPAVMEAASKGSENNAPS